MGIPLPDDEPEYGDPCIWCDVEHDGPWLVGKTPLKLFVMFVGMKLCPWHESDPQPPNLRVFTITQTSPCTWEFNDGTWWIGYYSYVSPSPYYSRLHLKYQLTKNYFRTDLGSQPKCSFFFRNDIICGDPVDSAHEGIGLVMPYPVLNETAELLNIKPEPTLFVAQIESCEIFFLTNPAIFMLY